MRHSPGRGIVALALFLGGDAEIKGDGHAHSGVARWGRKSKFAADHVRDQDGVLARHVICRARAAVEPEEGYDRVTVCRAVASHRD